MKSSHWGGRLRFFFIATLTVLASAGIAKAASGREGASFLDIPVGARPAALGSAYSALASDAYAPVWNPAGLGFVTGTQVAAQHLSYLQSIHNEYLGAAYALTEGKSLGISAQYLGSGDIAETTPLGDSNGSYSSHYGAYSVAYGQKITEKLALGMTGKWINAQLADVSANAYAADIGGLYQANDRLRLAATVTNMGSTLRFFSQGDSLPLASHLAVAYTPGKRWLLVVEGLYSKNGLWSERTGVEWTPLSMFSLRAGYKTDTLKQLSPLAGFTTGIGVKAWGQELSYAWLPYGDLGDTQYFSLLLRFGQTEEAKNLIQNQTIKWQKTNAGTNNHVNDPEFEQLLQLFSDQGEHMAQVGEERLPARPAEVGPSQ